MSRENYVVLYLSEMYFLYSTMHEIALKNLALTFVIA
jgi:hypothetical protein